MPMYLVERTFAEAFSTDDDELTELHEYFDARDVEWLTTFLSPDRKRSYCLYEAPSEDLLRQHAADYGMPLDRVIEVSELPIRPQPTG
jgi:hypothetical protein